MFPPPAALIHLPIFKRLLPSLWKRYMRVFKPAYFVERRLGFNHLIDQSNAIDRNLVTKGAWEPQQIKFVSQCVHHLHKNSKSVEFWDIGSHAGLYSIYLAHHHGLEVVHAFEPDPRSYAQLHGNLFINDLTDRVKVHKVAASNAAGESRFFMAIEGNRGASRLSDTGPETIIGEIVVETVRLDDFLKPVSDVILMKMDVEEHEQQVIEGMLETMKTQKVMLQVEIFEEHEVVMFELMKSLGFHLVKKVVYDHYFTNFDDDWIGL